MKPFRIRPYRAIGGFLLIYIEWQSWWFPTISDAMNAAAAYGHNDRLGGGKP